MIEQKIFAKRSTTYFASSRLFPPEVQADVTQLYSFVRVADDYVDSVPQNLDDFTDLKKAWQKGESARRPINNRVIKNIIQLIDKYDFPPGWIDSFLAAMESDTKHNGFESLSEVLEYVYGSAEVTGLMMARIIGAPKKADQFARLQGRAMQWLNFIRDIAEDNSLDRCYFPKIELTKSGLEDLSFITARKNQRGFKNFIRFQLERYYQWQKEAERGHKFIPSHTLIAVKNAVNQYDKTAQRIKKNPLSIFD